MTSKTFYPSKAPILLVSLVVAIMVSVLAFTCPKILDQLNVIVLSFTAVALVWTTLDARENATRALTANLRPAIFRNGVINWDTFKKATSAVQNNSSFLVTNNIATNVTGYVIFDRKRYPLVFTITIPTENPNEFKGTVFNNSVTSWAMPQKLILGTTFPSKHEHSIEPEGFYIQYGDIEGTRYETYENSNHQIRSKKL